MRVSDHDLWSKGNNRVTTMAPGPGDLFVVTTLGGKRVFVEPIDQYDHALRIAEGFARRIIHDRPVIIRVVPMTSDELLMHMGTTLEAVATNPSEGDSADRKLVVDTCMAALRECSDPAVREDALALLTSLGVLSG